MRRATISQSSRAGIGAVAALALLAGSAQGQVQQSLENSIVPPSSWRNGGSTGFNSNPLGSGRALDRNLQVGSGGVNNPVVNYEAQFRFNNAIVTGNAGFGRSFRGDVGYLASDDFRSSLGSDDLFQFRRDSALSNPTATGISGTRALQYQFDYATGQAPPTLLAQDPAVINRSAASFTSATFDSPLRSTGGYLSQQTLEPSVIGYTLDRDETTNLAITASPLLGVRGVALVPRDRPTPLEGQPYGPEDATGVEFGVPGTDNEWPRAAEEDGSIFADPARGQVGEAAEDAARPGADPTSLDANLSARLRPQDLSMLSGMEATTGLNLPSLDASRMLERRGGQLSPQARSATHAAVLDQFRREFGEEPGAEGETGEPTPGGTPGAEAEAAPYEVPYPEELQRIRRQLLDRRPTDPMEILDRAREDEADEDSDTGVTIPGRPEDDAPSEAEGVERDPLAPRARQLRDVEPDMSVEAIEALRRSRPMIRSLVAESTEADPLYLRHMRAGQEFLADGRFFDAEDRFTRALAARPADPMAAIGRVHAQIGGGLFVSAAENLRLFMLNYPEFIGARYGESLLPGEERSAQLFTLLDDQINAERSGLGRDSALLSAYLAYQTGDEERLVDSMETFREWARPAHRGEQNLIRLLDALWLPEGAENE